VSSITFETAAFAEVIKRAAKIAPSKAGLAFDKSSGIVIEFDPQSPVPLAVVRSTNLEIFCREWVNVTAWDGEPAQWRLPSALLAQVISTLPIGTGRTVTFESSPTTHSFLVNMKSGRTKVKFYPLDTTYYPEWEVFDPDDMYPANDIGGRLNQVEWAASTRQPELASIYLDGEYAVSTDRYKLACVPLNIPKLAEPIVIPAGLLGQILRQTGEIQVGVHERNFHIMPDEYTQIKTVVLETKFLPVDRVLSKQFDSSIKVNKDILIEMMQRVNSFALGDREAFFTVYIGAKQFGIGMQNQDLGQIGDVLDLETQADHPRFKVRFSPANLMAAIDKSPNKEITLYYNQGQSNDMVKIDGDSGYISFVSPRQEVAE
jgi:DNA polymerase III sliding clamp (beta) subunit (PCNA family)